MSVPEPPVVEDDSGEELPDVSSPRKMEGARIPTWFWVAVLFFLMFAVYTRIIDNALLNWFFAQVGKPLTMGAALDNQGIPFSSSIGALIVFALSLGYAFGKAQRKKE